MDSTEYARLYDSYLCKSNAVAEAENRIAELIAKNLALAEECDHLRRLIVARDTADEQRLADLLEDPS